jgi:hypothetical protein
MADAGKYVTDAEVISFLNSKATSLSTTEALLVKSIENAVDKFLNCTLIKAATVNERHYIELNNPNAVNFGIFPQNCLQFYVNRIPVVSVEALRQTQGLGTSAILSSNYTVEKDKGLIRINFMSSPLYPIYPYSNPINFYEFYIDYTAGFESGSIPADLKLPILMAISRYLNMQKFGTFHVDSLQGEFGSTQYLRVFLSEEERAFLEPFKGGGAFI